MPKVVVYQTDSKGGERVNLTHVEDAYYKLWQKYGMRLWGEVYGDQGVLYGICQGDAEGDTVSEVFTNEYRKATDKVQDDIERTFVVGEDLTPVQAVRAVIRQLAGRKAGKNIEAIMRAM